MKFFTNCKSLDELKAEYRRLIKIHHPDRGGDVETMKAINNEYEIAFEQLKRHHNATHDAEHQTTETADEYREILEKLLKLDGLDIELFGSWLWIGGETRKHKDALKAAGCRWSNNKKLWYWHHAEEGAKWHKGKATISEIRAKYGSQHITGRHYDMNEQLAGATA
ncbi:MAG: hypothetical protein K6G66_02420 [Oscillospiraceae bacterium]|nr:hypothetical protein [Oscillospiraceae bacterium]